MDFPAVLYAAHLCHRQCPALAPQQELHQIAAERRVASLVGQATIKHPRQLRQNDRFDCCADGTVCDSTGIDKSMKEIVMNLKKNLIKSIVLTTLTVIIGIASVLGADARHAVKR